MAAWPDIHLREQRRVDAKMWDPLHKMLTKKLGKNYDPEAQPISLLLYYSSSPSFWKFLRPLVTEKAAHIQGMVESGIFDGIWLFDMTQREILFVFSKSSTPLIT
jgi:hypothetical protein